MPILAAQTFTTAPGTNVTWRYMFLGVTAGHEYLVRAKTRDSNGGLSQMTQTDVRHAGNGTRGGAAAPAGPGHHSSERDC